MNPTAKLVAAAHGVTPLQWLPREVMMPRLRCFSCHSASTSAEVVPAVAFRAMAATSTSTRAGS